MNQKWYRGGYLFVKQSAKDRKRGLKPWRRKFVAVHQNACTTGISLLFELYQDEFTYRQVTCVLLNDITSVRRCTSRTNRHAFAVLSPSRQLYLAADSETDALEWIAMLRKFMVKKAVRREPSPAESEDGDVFNVSILPNDHSERLEIYENYQLTTNSPYLCLYNSRSRIVLQWKLVHLKRFMLTKKCHEKDTDKILYISTNSRCKNGECEIAIYCNRGKQLIAKLLEEVSRNKKTRISRRRSITSSMIFDITPEDLAILGTISESSSDDDAFKRGNESPSNQTREGVTLGRGIRPRHIDGVVLRQKSPALQRATGRQWRTPTVGKPVLKKRRAPPPPPSPSSTTSSSSSDKRSLEYSPSIASSSSTVTSDFDLSSVPEDGFVSEPSQCGTLKASTSTGTTSDDSATSTSPKEQRAYKGTAPLKSKPSPPRPIHPPKLSPMLQAKYKLGSVETLSSNKENFNSPPVSPRSLKSANSSFSSSDGSSPPIPPRRRKQKHATLERCTNIHTEMEKQSTPKPTLMQIVNGEVTRKASTLQRDKLTLVDLGNGGNYNNNSSASASSDDAASESDGCYTDESDDVITGHWHYDIRPYINTAGKVKMESKDNRGNKSLVASNESSKENNVTIDKGEEANFTISSQSPKSKKEEKDNMVTEAHESESDDNTCGTDMSDVERTKQIVSIENDNKNVSDNKQQIEITGKVDVNERHSGTSSESELNTSVDKELNPNRELKNANGNLDYTDTSLETSTGSSIPADNSNKCIDKSDTTFEENLNNDNLNTDRNIEIKTESADEFMSEKSEASKETDTAKSDEIETDKVIRGCNIEKGNVDEAGSSDTGRGTIEPSYKSDQTDSNDNVIEEEIQ